MLCRCGHLDINHSDLNLVVLGNCYQCNCPDFSEVTMQDSNLICVKCGSRPSGGTQPSVDQRWRLGRCPDCGKSAVFAKKSE